jgi:PAS domain S-box-containing protein
MKMHLRLILVVSLAALFCAEMLYVHHRTGENASLGLHTARTQLGSLFETVIQIQGETLRGYANDYTHWDEMAEFVATGDKRWAAENIEASLDMYGVDAVWVLKTDGTVVYATKSGPDGAPAVLPLPVESLGKAFAERRFVHFCALTPSGPLEVRGATIHRAQDVERPAEPQGWLLAARRWDDEQLGVIGKVIGGTVTVARTHAAEAGGLAEGEIVVHYDMPGIDGQPAATLCGRIVSSPVQQLIRDTRQSFYLTGAFSLALMCLLGALLVRWVDAPLRKIVATLDARDVGAIAGMQEDITEFGQIARLIREFFEQQERLVSEVAERKAAQEALAGSRRDLANLMSNLPGMTYRAAYNGRRKLEYVSDGCYDLTGYSPDEIVGDAVVAFEDMVEAGDRERMKEEIDKAIQARGSYHVTYAIRTQSWRRKWVLDQGRGVFGEDESLTAIEGIATDVTEAKEAEEALKESEERYRGFIEHFNGIAYRARLDYIALYCHGAVEAITGYTEKQLCSGKPRLDEIVHHEDVDEFHDWTRTMLATPGGSLRREYRIVRPDGQVRFLSEYAQTIMDATGAPAFIQGIAYDVTEQRATGMAGVPAS